MNSNFACKGTTNIWNTQGFNEENANLFVILFVKCLLFAQTCERIFEVGRLLASRVGVLEGTTNIWNTQGFFHYSLKKFAYIIFLLYICSKNMKGGLMLGVKSRRKPISGEFAQNLRDQIHRYETGQLNEEDRKRIAFLNQPREHEVIA